MDCIFCKIAAGEVKSDAVYEDDAVIAIRDLNPQAPVHILVIPKTHVANITELTDKALAAHIFTEVVPKITSKLGIATGFRIVINTGDDGGQTVNHLHVHILGGRKMTWPPG